MLVLTRKTGEQVFIEGGIRVQVLSVQGNKVRLGFEAPEDVAIQREEICFDPTDFGQPASSQAPRVLCQQKTR